MQLLYPIVKSFYTPLIFYNAIKNRDKKFSEVDNNFLMDNTNYECRSILFKCYDDLAFHSLCQIFDY